MRHRKLDRRFARDPTEVARRRRDQDEQHRQARRPQRAAHPSVFLSVGCHQHEPHDFDSAATNTAIEPITTTSERSVSTANPSHLRLGEPLRSSSMVSQRRRKSRGRPAVSHQVQSVRSLP
jgi:hypothetical protein